MGKLILLIIIITLVTIIISLFYKDINTNDKVNQNNSERKRIDDLISELKDRVNQSKKEAQEGKVEMLEKMFEYERQLKQAEELNKKFN